MGVPVDILMRTCLSKTGLRVSQLTSGNIILNEDGLGTASKVLSYLTRGPQLPKDLEPLVSTIATTLKLQDP